MKTVLPEYTSGCFNLYRITDEGSSDFPVEKLKNQKMTIWYNEISVFDHTRYALNQGGIEVTMKIRIPRYNGIDSKCVCVIDGVNHQVYNATHITNKSGFPETEITLKTPDKEYEVIEDDEAGTE